MIFLFKKWNKKLREKRERASHNKWEKGNVLISTKYEKKKEVGLSV